MHEVKFRDLGVCGYKEAWDLQKTLFNEAINAKLEGRVPEMHLLFCEHPHVYTIGKSGEMKNMLLSAAEMERQDVKVYEIERGGDITYHGPGQLVVYPVFDLEQLGIGVKQFVSGIEESVINVLKKHCIIAERIENRIGIWLSKGFENERKIAAIGIKCSRHITMHGLAMNVNTNLGMFDQIVPCGISDKSVSSMEKELGRQLDMDGIKKDMENEFSITFDLKLINK